MARRFLWLILFVCLAAPARAQVAFDAGTYGGFTVGTSFTVAHTTSGSNRYLAICILGDETVPGNTVTGATYNGVAMTLSRPGQLHNRYLYMFGLTAPASGTHDVVVSASGASFLQLMIASWTGVSQTGQPEVAVDANNSGSALTTSLTTLTNNAWTVECFGSSSGIGSTTNFTERVHDSDFNGMRVGDNGPISPAGSATMTVDSTGTNESVMISLAPVAVPRTTLPLLGAELQTEPQWRPF